MADSSDPKKSTKIILAVILTVIVVAAVLVGVYYYLPNQISNKPDVVTNFKDGACANYSLTIYNPNGTISSVGNMMASTHSGTYNSKDCWVYVENVTYTSTDDAVINDAITYYLDKTTYATLHQTEWVTSDDAVAYDASFNPGDAGFMDTIAIVRNMTVTATGKSVNVPAGTFSTTERQGPITYVSEATTYDVTSWASNDVPTWGMVKYQFRLSGVLFSEYLLEAYGS